MEELRVYPVPAAQGGERLDAFLARVSGLSRAQVQRLIAAGRVHVAGRARKAGFRLSAGQEIRLAIPPPRPSGLSPEPIPLTVLYEDEAILVLDKPPGIVVHPAAGRRTGTLVNALLAHCPELPGIGGVDRPGIVHRLDRDTSGCLVVAKSDRAHRSLAEQFKVRSVDKLYLALVHDIPSPAAGRISLPVGRREGDRKRMGVRSRRAREAETHYRVLRRGPGWSLVEVRPATGRTHQIRVHLAAIGHPVVGDRVYGGRRERRGTLRPPRQLLHAWRLAFTHPVTGTRVSFEAPPPIEFRPFLP
ncbi:MAG: RluA family pseudouridine synthase [Candidatus Methylomirabilales bacterium]